MVNELLSITISIHSLRVEGDTNRLKCDTMITISIHSLRVEGDSRIRRDGEWMPFQSTPSVWRETSHFVLYGGGSGTFQSTPSVWRETHPQKGNRPAAKISIHSLRVEGDWLTMTEGVEKEYFNPLPPCGGRRKSDTQSVPLSHFNPLPPCGGRRIRPAGVVSVIVFQSTPSVWRETDSTSSFAPRMLFQSTPSVWRETQKRIIFQRIALISIHSLRVEGDAAMQCHACCGIVYFNPLPPCGGRRCTATAKILRQRFQSTPSVWRETPELLSLWAENVISIHSLRVEGDRASTLHISDRVFQSTPSVWRET